MMDKRAVLYARVSGDDRGNDGRNLAGQLEMCREYALQNGWVVLAELAEDDRGASGASFELPELNQVREMAHNSEFDILVVREIDRLSRNLAKQLIVEEELKRSGVQIEYALGEYPDTPEGRLNKHIRATIAEYEREKINERMIRGRRLKARAGNVIVHGHPPYGYKVEEVDGKMMLVVHEPEAKVVRSIFTWYVHGDESGKPLSIKAIARKLEGIPTKQDLTGSGTKTRGYGKWASASVHGILKNETYAGVWRYGKNHGKRVQRPAEYQITVEVPAIVSREDWQGAQDRRQENKRQAKGRRKFYYMLRGRVTCGECGGTMYGHSHVDLKSGKPYSYYQCRSLSRPDRYPDHTCTTMRFRADHVDTAVWDWIRSLLTEPHELMEQLMARREKQEVENAPLRERLKVVDDLQADNRRQLERLIDLYLTSEFSKEVLVDRKQRLESTIEALAKERNNLLAHLEARALTAEQIQSIQDFSTKVRKGFIAADADDQFETRRKIMAEMDVRVILTIEDNEKVGYASCILGEEVLHTISKNTGTGWRAGRCRFSGMGEDWQSCNGLNCRLS